jgi:hypothetical protein
MLGFLSFKIKAKCNSAADVMQYIANKENYDEYQRPKSCFRERDLRRPEKPADRSRGERQFSRMLRQVASVVLICFPKFLSCHRGRGPGGLRVPGFPVGGGLGGGDGSGGNGVGVRILSFSMINYALLCVPGFPVGVLRDFFFCETRRSLSRTLLRESTPKRSFSVPSFVRGSTFLNSG